MNKVIAVNQLKNKTAEILIYGYIGNDVVSGDFVRELKSLEASNDVINVRINSGGGSIFEGLAIFNAILNSKAEVNGYIDGMAASMASVIAMACKKVYMSKVAMFMTHRASGMASGSANSMRNYAQLMENLEDAMCNIYANKTGLTCEEAKAKYLDNGDRWITAQEALTEKIIDGIYDGAATQAPPANMREEHELVGFYASTLNLQNQFTDMLKINLTADQALKLSLKSDADQTAVATAIDALIAKADKVDGLQTQLQAAVQEKTKAVADLKTLKEATVATQVTEILATALGEKKITAKVQTKLAADYATNPTGLKELVDSLPAYAGVTEKIAAAEGSVNALAAKTWNELDMAGELEALKAADLNLFKEKYRAEFKSEYAGK